MSDENYKRKLTAILSADSAGHSRLMGDDETETIHTLKNHCSAAKIRIDHNRGRVIDIVGDNILAVFRSVLDAVICATEIQREVEKWNKQLPDKRKMEFRIGINVSDVVEKMAEFMAIASISQHVYKSLRMLVVFAFLERLKTK